MSRSNSGGRHSAGLLGAESDESSNLQYGDADDNRRRNTLTQQDGPPNPNCVDFNKFIYTSMGLSSRPAGTLNFSFMCIEHY